MGASCGAKEAPKEDVKTLWTVDRLFIETFDHHGDAMKRLRDGNRRFLGHPPADASPRRPAGPSDGPPRAGSRRFTPEDEEAMRRSARMEYGHVLELGTSKETREKLAELGQRPYAACLTCSDARVVPELIFNLPLGALYSVRNAGAVVGPESLASLEYAVGVLGINLVVLLGHDKCPEFKGTLRALATGSRGRERAGSVQSMGSAASEPGAAPAPPPASPRGGLKRSSNGSALTTTGASGAELPSAGKGGAMAAAGWGGSERVADVSQMPLATPPPNAKRGQRPKPKRRGSLSGLAHMEVEDHVKQQYVALLRGSDVIRDAVRAGTTHVAIGVYYIQSGVVSWVTTDGPSDAAGLDRMDRESKHREDDAGSASGLGDGGGGGDGGGDDGGGELAREDPSGADDAGDAGDARVRPTADASGSTADAVTAASVKPQLSVDTGT